MTNPTNQPGLCKHLLALKKYITGLYTHFESELPDDGRYLDRMVRAANRQTISAEGRPISPPRADQAVSQSVSPSDAWTSAARGTAPAATTPPPAPRASSIVRPGQPHPNAVPQELPPPATPRQRERAGRRRESLDLVVMDMKPVEQDLQILLREAEEDAALTPPPAPAPEGGEDLVSLVRSIRDMIAKLVGGEETAAPEAPPAPAPEDKPAIPDDAERVASST